MREFDPLLIAWLLSCHWFFSTGTDTDSLNFCPIKTANPGARYSESVDHNPVPAALFSLDAALRRLSTKAWYATDADRTLRATVQYSTIPPNAVCTCTIQRRNNRDKTIHLINDRGFPRDVVRNCWLLSAGNAKPPLPSFRIGQTTVPLVQPFFSMFCENGYTDTPSVSIEAWSNIICTNGQQKIPALHSISDPKVMQRGMNASWASDTCKRNTTKTRSAEGNTRPHLHAVVMFSVHPSRTATIYERHVGGVFLWPRYRQHSTDMTTVGC